MSLTILEKAHDFLHGVATADPDLVTRHVDPDLFTDHGPLAVDGAMGLWKRVDEGPTAGANVTIVRHLQDGPLLIVQHDAGEPGRKAAFDVFCFDREIIMEHWAFVGEDGAPNVSDHTQVDGPTEPRHLEDTERNKATIRDYYGTVHLAGRHDEARRWFLPSGMMVRHEPGVADGVEEFLRDLAILTRDRTIDAVELIAGEGDFVFLIARGTFRDEPCAYVDLYRVEDDRIAEHWGFPERV